MIGAPVLQVFAGLEGVVFDDEGTSYYVRVLQGSTSTTGDAVTFFRLPAGQNAVQSHDTSSQKPKSIP
ncbi:hypothetical protein VD0002_g8895 [Verticillium dahliae]|uniref:Uncharacterized protein n=1 Tax=Verticillium dahliae TaxID=27337 RepID=A0AA45AH37_VERDA|nr:hypothetical protein BJF96_g10014 [Verticillium dahliae]PNH37453.1 hypothetical protein VD0004_g9341 [Verticillium dahliae]PNH44449.1 hypothetical protein VD0003_g9417 [Verticillium dahliae]PNH58634.1 hypothetical protein VD0002_g8895 [Verticillium dahliae]PNH74650.1 hypothetical protein VD0001_g2934 [Verticillium dahliae]